MKIWEYFTIYYGHFEAFSKDEDCSDPSYQSWVKTEEEHTKETGSGRYSEYRTFRVIKSRFMRSRFIGMIKTR